MRYFLTIILLLSFNLTKAQDTTSKISLAYENKTIGEVLDQIESLTNYHFFYVNDWLGTNVISGNYTDTPVATILQNIFEQTKLNFYLFKNDKIILTRNNIIYDSLPEGFFPKKKEEVIVDTEEEIQENINPVFYKEERANTPRRVETVRIGKEDRNNKQKRFKLTGNVQNIRTGGAIANLAILVKNRNIGTATDRNGYYEIELPAGLNIIETSALGIETVEKRVIIYNNGQLNFNLDENAELLDEVVLEADADRNVKETISGATKIDVEESKNIPLVLGERDVLKVATTLPGITTTGEGTIGFNVRGGRSDQNLVLLDNAVIYNPQHFFGIFSALNPFVIGEVNIYKGSIPAQYGGRLSSVFEINSKKGNTEKFSGEASIGPVTSNLALEIPIVKGKSSLTIGGRGAYSDYILEALDDESISNSQASFYDAIIRYDHKINDKNTIAATGYFSRDDFSITSDSLFIYRNRVASLQWDHKFNEKNTGSLLITNSQYDFNIEFDNDENNSFDLDYQIQETEVKLKLKHQSNPGLIFDYGISSKLYNVNPGSIDPLGPASTVESVDIEEERGLESAAFFSAKFDVNEKLSFDAGIRYSAFLALGAGSQRVFADNVPRVEDAVIDTLNFDRNEVIETYGGSEFRLSGRYLITPEFSVKASFNSTIQYIHTLSNNTTVSPIDTYTLSNLNIEPQRARQFSLGFFKNFQENTYEVSLEGFFKTSDNIIDFRVGAQTLLNENIETEVLQGDGEAYGVEFLIRKNKGKLNGWLGYTYSRSFTRFNSEFLGDRINNGEFFPANFDKPHDVSLVANYKFNRRLSLSTNFVYQTGRPITFPVGNFNFNNSQFVAFSERNQFRIPDFFRLDIGLNIEGNHKIKKFARSFWTISIFNVLGRNNPFSVFFVTDEGEVRAFQSSIFSIPIPSITYNFKF